MVGGRIELYCISVAGRAWHLYSVLCAISALISERYELGESALSYRHRTQDTKHTKQATIITLYDSILNDSSTLSLSISIPYIPSPRTWVLHVSTPSCAIDTDPRDDDMLNPSTRLLVRMLCLVVEVVPCVLDPAGRLVEP